MEVSRGGEGSIGDAMPVNRSLAGADACSERSRTATPIGSAGIAKADTRHISSHRFALSQPGVLGAGWQLPSCIIEAMATGAPIEIAISLAATADMLIVNAISAPTNIQTSRWTEMRLMGRDNAQTGWRRQHQLRNRDVLPRGAMGVNCLIARVRSCPITRHLGVTQARHIRVASDPFVTCWPRSKP